MILIIDDNRDVLALYTRAFKDAGVSVVGVSDTEVSVESISKHNPAMILLDLVMPHQAGLSILRKLKRNKKTCNLRTLLITNSYDEPSIVEGMRLGAEGYLIKALYTPKEIVQKVCEVLKNPRGESKGNLGRPFSSVPASQREQ